MMTLLRVGYGARMAVDAYWGVGSLLRAAIARRRN